MKKIFSLFFLIVILVLSSCKNITSTLPDTTLSNITTTENPSTATLTNPITYTKDEEGFYILPEDFFSSKAEENPSLLQSSFVYAKNGQIKKYDQVRVYASGVQLDCYEVMVNMSQTWNGDAPSRMANGVCFLALEGNVKIQIQTNFFINDVCTIRPLSSSITPSIDEETRVISFEITSPGQYAVELRSGRVVYFFVDEVNQYEQYKDDDNLLYFGPGVYNKDNSSLIDQNGNLYLNSDTTLFIDYGASLECSIIASHKNNIKIVGGGMISGASFPRSVANNQVKVPIDINYCNNVKIDGIAVLDPAGWCYNIYFSNNVQITNTKVISSRSNGDGISLQSSCDVAVSKSFLRTWDDTLVVKNYPHWDNLSNLGATRNIEFSDCILWTDLAQSMEIGYETYGEVMDNIVFNNITVLHNFHKAVISIHDGNNANITNVRFTNITVEDASMGKGDGVNVLIDFSTAFSPTWSLGHGETSLGSIDGVLIENILVLSGNAEQYISIKGATDNREQYLGSIHPISNVTIRGITIFSDEIDQSFAGILTNEYVSSLTIEQLENVSGSSIFYRDSSLYTRSAEGTLVQ